MLTTLVLTLLLADVPDEGPVLDRPVPVLLTDLRFRQELTKPLTATWANVPLRTVLRRISETRKVSIVLDRRIDPTHKLLIDLTGVPLGGGIETIAEQVGARVTVVGNTVFVGPPESTGKLRTLVVLRNEELLHRAADLPQGRLKQLAGRATIHWNDLDRPAEILAEIGRRFDLQIVGLEEIPHDLWAATTLPQATAVEALSMILIQFDLTFAWTDQAEGVRLVPVPEEVGIARTYRPRGMTAREAAEKWTAQIEGLRAAPVGRDVRVVGTIEQHEAVVALSGPSGRRLPRGRPRANRVPVNQRTFTKLTFQRVPALALIKKLEETGIVFRYDAEQLAEAGIDLKTPISMDLKNVSAEEVLRRMCEPLGLQFRVDGATVTLEPK